MAKRVFEIAKELGNTEYKTIAKTETMENATSPTEEERSERLAVNLAQVLGDTATRFFEEGKRAQSSRPPQAQTGARPKTGNKPRIPSATEYAEAAHQHDLKELVSKEADYPYDNQTRLDYEYKAGVFLPQKDIPRAPTHPFRVFNDGKSVISYTTIDHFKGRCSSCGMDGHSASHPKCVYANCSPTYHLCSRCGTGFHAPQKCAIDLNRVAPPPRSTRQGN